MVVLGIGTARAIRFGGGTLGTPAAVPPRAALAGTTDAGSVFRSRGMLYLRREGQNGATRLLRLPPAHAPRPLRPPDALAIGDSVLLEFADPLRRNLAGWLVDVEAGVSWTTFVGIDIAESRGRSIRNAVVVELGTNEGVPPEFADRMRTLLRALRHVRLVAWLTVRGVADYVPGINAAIRTVAAEFPNTVVIDWERTATPDLFLRDGVHLTTKGRKTMARLVAGTLKTWLAAAEGRGATSCLPAVEQALGL